jgi:hypothetical protein
MPLRKFTTTITHTLDFESYLDYQRDIAAIETKYGVKLETVVASEEDVTIEVTPVAAPEKVVLPIVVEEGDRPTEVTPQKSVLDLDSDKKFLTPRQAIAVLMNACKVTTYKQLGDDFLETHPGNISGWCRAKDPMHPGSNNRQMLVEALEVYAGIPGVVIIAAEPTPPEVLEAVEESELERVSFMPVALYTKDVVEQLLKLEEYSGYGGDSKLARDVGVTPGSIFHWKTGNNAAQNGNLESLQQLFRDITGNYDALILPGLRGGSNGS